MDIFVILGTMLTVVSLCLGIIYISCNWGKMTKDNSDRYNIPMGFPNK